MLSVCVCVVSILKFLQRILEHCLQWLEYWHLTDWLVTWHGLTKVARPYVSVQLHEFGQCCREGSRDRFTRRDYFFVVDAVNKCYNFGYNFLWLLNLYAIYVIFVCGSLGH